MKFLKCAMSIVLTLIILMVPMLCTADETVDYKITLSSTIDGSLPLNTTFEFEVKCYHMDESDEDKEMVVNDKLTLDSAKDAVIEYKLDNAKVDAGGYVYEFKLLSTNNKLAVVDGRVFAVYLFGKQNGVKTFDSSIDGEEAEKLYDDISNGLSLTAAFNCKTAVQVKAELSKNEFTKVYDGTDAYTVADTDYKLTGVAEGDDVKLQIGAAKFNSADVKLAEKVIFSELTLTGADAGKYKLTSDKIEVKGKITPRPITVTADDKVMTEGAVEPELTYTLSESLIAGNEFVGSLARTSGTEAGEYAITRGTLSLTDNYELTFVEGKFTISSFTNVTVSDEKTSITVSGFFAPDSTITVSELSVADNTYKVLAAGATWGKIHKGYTITLNSASHDGVMTVTIPVDAEYNGKEFSIYQLLSSGGIACYKSVAADGKVTLNTDECTSFLLVSEKEKTEENKTPIGMIILKVFLILLAIIAGLILLVVLFFFGMVFFNKTDELKKIIKTLKKLFKNKK